MRLHGFRRGRFTVSKIMIQSVPKESTENSLLWWCLFPNSQCCSWDRILRDNMILVLDAIFKNWGAGQTCGERWCVEARLWWGAWGVGHVPVRLRSLILKQQGTAWAFTRLCQQIALELRLLRERERATSDEGLPSGWGKSRSSYETTGKNI